MLGEDIESICVCGASLVKAFQRSWRDRACGGHMSICEPMGKLTISRGCVLQLVRNTCDCLLCVAALTVQCSVHRQ